MTWTEWEQPWTRTTGPLADYEPITDEPELGQMVAIRQTARPYLPTFAPWWTGLYWFGRDGDTVTVQTENHEIRDVDLAERPMATHWAVRKELTP